MPLRSLKLKWAWQVQFLSHTQQILGKVIFFEDSQMMLLSSLEIFIFTKIGKNVPKLDVQVCSTPWLRLLMSYIELGHVVKALWMVS